jgi:sugar O-acyltransferase (sialic acid O-acetyltransferase NeuD family)
MALSDANLPTFDPEGRTFYILGSSGFAREIKNYLSEMHVDTEQVVFVDDNSDDSINVMEYNTRINKDPMSYSIMGVGHPKIKIKMADEIKGRLFSIKHMRSYVANSSEIGDGCVIAPGAVISNNAKIGRHVLLNYNTTIGHDSVVDDYSVVSPNASVGGWVKIDSGVYIGAGSQLIERIRIGENSIVGMGAVVVRDVPKNHMAVGNPAKFYSFEEWEEKRR